MRANARSFAMPVVMLPTVDPARTGSVGEMPTHWHNVAVQFAPEYVAV